jgi:hypothetical protein
MGELSWAEALDIVTDDFLKIEARRSALAEREAVLYDYDFDRESKMERTELRQDATFRINAKELQELHGFLQKWHQNDDISLLLEDLMNSFRDALEEMELYG